MEHEDNNTQFDNNYLRGNLDEFSLQHNQQNLVENLQNASGFGAGGIVGVVEEIGSVGGGVCIGGKFDEEEHDEEEWKYIQEVQQSEKQQQQQQKQKMLKIGEGVGDGVVGGLDEYDEDEGGDDQVILPRVEYDEEESAIIKNDGDFSTTSNTTSTTVGEEENSATAEEEPHQFKAMHDVDVEAPLRAQVEKVEKEEAIELLGNANNSPETVAEKSSMPTGKNCENLQYFGEQQETLPEKIDDMFLSSSPLLCAAARNVTREEQKYEADKENADPAVAATAAGLNLLEDINYAADSHTEPQSLRPSELDFEMHSNLNPDAKEFVPVHSNPTSPVSPVKSNDFLSIVGSTEDRQLQPNASPIFAFVDGGKNVTGEDLGSNDNLNERDVEDSLMGDVVVGEPALSTLSVSPHPNSVPRHMIGNNAGDDVVAQSPRKGRGLDMDEISLPAVNDFELEANERPHEIEQENNVVGDIDSRNEIDNKDAALKQMENGEKMHCGAGDAGVDDYESAEYHMEISTSKDYTDFKHPLDHGPETSVDLDMDSQDVMKQSFYIENNTVGDMDTQEEELQEICQKQPIEELLNTVQPIPTDSESINNSFDDLIDIPSKEMLNIEEKEVISHSPSTEEIQMQFQNDFNASSKDVSAIPIDLDSIGHMQDSFYMERTDTQNSMETEIRTMEAAAARVPVDELVSLPTLQEDFITDTITPHKSNESIKNNSELLTETAQPETAAIPMPADLQFTDFPVEKEDKELITPTSYHSTEEKHLMEETKEHLDLEHGMNELEQKMDNLLLEHDSSLQKVDEVALSAIPINEEEFASFVQESDIMQPRHEDLFFEEEHLHTISSPLLEPEHHHYVEEISAPLIETPTDPHVSQMQVGELMSPVQEVISVTKTDAEHHVKHDEAPLIVDDIPAPVPTTETTITTVEEPFLLTEATVSVPTDEVAAVTTEVAEAAAATTVAIAATAATVAAVAATRAKKSTEPIKKPGSIGKGTALTATVKSKLSTSGDAKKSTGTKKPATAAAKTSTLSATARPRTAPASSATTTEKKTTTTTTTKPATHATTARKPVANTVTTTKSAKPTATGTTATRNGVPAKTPATRPATALLASRKLITTTNAAAPTQPAAPKPRPTTAGAPPKPSTLNIANKPKAALSPRATLTSQLRKTGGGTTGAATTAKSPNKTAAIPATNGSGKPPQVTSSSTANRTKTSTATTTSTTKTFTARPAPKTTSTLTTTSTLNTTIRRATSGSATKSSSNPIQRKSSPSKPSSTTLGGKMTPTKPNAISKNKTKDVTTPKSVGKTIEGPTAVLKSKTATVELVEQPKINGNSCIAAGGEPLEHTENGGTHDHHTNEENGSIEQGEMALMDGTAA